MAARVSDFRPPDRASPTVGAAFRTGPRPTKSASTQPRPTLRTNPCVSTKRRPALRTSSDASTQPRPTLRTSSDASTEPRTTLRTSSDASSQRRPPVRPIPFVSEERRPTLRPVDFHFLFLLPGRIADETGIHPVRTRRRQAKAVSPPSEHRTTMRRCDAQSRFLSRCAAQSHLSRRRFRRWRPANEPASPRGIRNNSAPSPPAPRHACQTGLTSARSAARGRPTPAAACTCTASVDVRESHKDTPALPFCNLKLKSPRPIDRAYPTELRSIGDHVRKRRLDLGLLQKEVALRIGVDKTTVNNWEAGTAFPSLRAQPAVIEFLEYDPRQIPDDDDWGRLIRHLRQRQGLSMEALAEVLGVDTSTVRGWECRGHRPWPGLHARLVEALSLPAVEAGAEATFGERLRAARLYAGLTQRELAGRMGVVQRVVSNWESGRKEPGRKGRTQISETLGLGS